MNLGVLLLVSLATNYSSPFVDDQVKKIGGPTSDKINTSVNFICTVPAIQYSESGPVYKMKLELN